MSGLCRCAAALLLLLATLPCSATDDPPPSTRQAHVWATLTIDVDGRPTQVAFPEDQQLAPALKAELGPRLARAEFHPVVHEGGPVQARTPAYVSLEFDTAPDGTASVRIVDVVPMVRALHRVQPYFPPRALKRGIEGEVLMRCVIGDDGRCSSIDKLEGPRFRDFAVAAKEALRHWRFEPVRVDGRSVSTIHIPFGFRQSKVAATVHDDEVKKALADGRIRLRRWR